MTFVSGQVQAVTNRFAPVFTAVLLTFILALCLPVVNASSSMPYLVYNFTPVSALKVETVSHLFRYLNSGKSAQIITGLVPSCGCTSAVLIPDGVRKIAFPMTLIPGESLLVKMTINVEFLSPGLIDKFVYLMAKNNAPISALEMSGAVLAPVELSPQNLDFGDVPEGTTKYLDITVGTSPSLLTSGRPSKIVGTADLTVVTVPKGPALDDSLPAQSYRITLSPATPMGQLHESLSWTSGDGAVSVAIPVRGDVIGLQKSPHVN